LLQSQDLANKFDANVHKSFLSLIKEWAHQKIKDKNPYIVLGKAASIYRYDSPDMLNDLSTRVIRMALTFIKQGIMSIWREGDTGKPANSVIINSLTDESRKLVPFAFIPHAAFTKELNKRNIPVPSWPAVISSFEKSRCLLGDSVYNIKGVKFDLGAWNFHCDFLDRKD
jgi:hypothetical protein